MKIDFLKKMGKTGAAVLAAAAVVCTLSGCNSGPKFQSVTLELGNTQIGLEHFLAPDVRAEKASFVTDMAAIDLSQVGEHPVTLRYGKNEETVTLSVVDTTAPQAVFASERTVHAGEELKAEDFVESASDLSGTTVSFVQEPVIPEDYSDLTVELAVTDGAGNRTVGQCKVSFLWMPESITWELGKPITKKDVLFNHKADDALLDQTQLDAINEAGIGSYTLTSEAGGRKLSCAVTVQDTQGPKLELHYVHIWPQEYVTIKDFIVSVEDPSGVASTELLSELDTLTKGERPVKIKATDTLGNETIGETIIKVNLDHAAPEFSTMEDIHAEKGVTPDYTTGITVTDNVDGELTFTYDDSKVDLESAGVYYVSYTAEDAAGNETVVRRRVIVPPDDADIQAIVDEVAAQLSDDPKELRDFVWKKIRYSASWGEPHPVWHGFNNWSGNCLVHAECLKALLDAKGYETQLIWTRDKSHYWVLVKLDEGWRHMDATPSEQHLRVLYMKDWDRYVNLDGRDWDRTAWPKAE